MSQKFPYHFLEESLPLLSSDIQWHIKILKSGTFGSEFYFLFVKPLCVTEVPASLKIRCNNLCIRFGTRKVRRLNQSRSKVAPKAKFPTGLGEKNG